jgi:hypothetical protein
MKKRLLKKNKDSYREIARKSTHHVIKGDMISENVKKSMIGSIKSYESNKKPNIKRKILNYLKPFALTNPSTNLLHYGFSKLFNTFQNHSIENFIKK